MIALVERIPDEDLRAAIREVLERQASEILMLRRSVEDLNETLERERLEFQRELEELKRKLEMVTNKLDEVQRSKGARDLM